MALFYLHVCDPFLQSLQAILPHATNRALPGAKVPGLAGMANRYASLSITLFLGVVSI